MDSEMLSILCTPDTRKPLREASESQISRVNAEISQGKLKTVGGTLLSEPLEDALVSEDGTKLYPVKNGIPVLLTDEAIALSF